MAIFTYNEQAEARFNVWFWTECDGEVLNIVFKRGTKRPQNAIAFNSETFDLAYCSTNPNLYVTSDIIRDYQYGLSMDMFAVGYFD